MVPLGGFTEVASTPRRRPTSRTKSAHVMNVPMGFPGAMLNTGMPARRAVSTAVRTVGHWSPRNQPGTQNAWAPRAITGLTASTT